jgi:hypothetical protein
MSYAFSDQAVCHAFRAVVQRAAKCAAAAADEHGGGGGASSASSSGAAASSGGGAGGGDDVAALHERTAFSCRQALRLFDVLSKVTHGDTHVGKALRGCV